MRREDKGVQDADWTYPNRLDIISYCLSWWELDWPRIKAPRTRTDWIMHETTRSINQIRYSS